ncbi:hypothetical protein BDV93DRAFT_553851 [Ceratobasidium sp. AG-I]|nr:hypothetical protein BDV93DRAFT_553851 [Ceratobasidium sp. AG-I]
MSQTSSNIRGAGSRRNSERTTRADTRTGPERMNEGIGQSNSRPQSRATEDDQDRTEEIPPVPPVNTEEQPVISTIPMTPEPIQPVASGSRRTIPGGLPSFEVSEEQGHGNQSEPTIRQPTPGRPVRLPNFGIGRNRTATVGPEEEEAVGASSRIITNPDETYARHPLTGTLVRSAQGSVMSQHSVPPTPNTGITLSSLTGFAPAPSITGTEMVRRAEANENARERRLEAETRALIREEAEHVLRPIQEQFAVRTIPIAEIGQTTRVLVQSNNAILEQIRGTNDRMDRVEDEIRETERNNRANTANIYQAGLDIRTNMNHVRAVQEQLRNLANMPDSMDRIRNTQAVMTNDLGTLRQMMEQQNRQLANIFETLQGIDNRIPVPEDDAHSISSITTISIRGFDDDLPDQAQSSQRGRQVPPHRPRFRSPGPPSDPDSSRPSSRERSPVRPRRDRHRERREERRRNRSRSHSPAIPREAQIKKPEPFKGKRGKDADHFMLQMEIYFRSHGQAFADDHRKISTFLLNIKDLGSGWARVRLQRRSLNTSEKSCEKKKPENV